MARSFKKIRGTICHSKQIIIHLNSHTRRAITKNIHEASAWRYSLMTFCPFGWRAEEPTEVKEKEKRIQSFDGFLKGKFVDRDEAKSGFVCFIWNEMEIYLLLFSDVHSREHLVNHLNCPIALLEQFLS